MQPDQAINELEAAASMAPLTRAQHQRIEQLANFLRSMVVSDDDDPNEPEEQPNTELDLKVVEN